MFFRIYAKTSEINFDVSTPSVGTIKQGHCAFAHKLSQA
jgi:hypothetical protein